MSTVLKPGGAAARPKSERPDKVSPKASLRQVSAVGGGSAALPVAAYPPGVEQYLGILAAKDGLRRLHRSVLRTGSIDARELQAAHATQRALTWDGLRNALLRYCSEGVLDAQVDSILARLPALPLMTLARVVALQNLLPTDRRVALALYGRVLAHHGARVFRKPHAKLLLDLAYQFSERELLRRGLREFQLDSIERASLTADMLNPAHASEADESTWLEAVNTCLEGVAKLALLPEEGYAFDRLDTTPVAATSSGPKVTVALTAWCPDEGLITAFRSIANQTWRNLEILVMDDHSPAEFLPLLRAVVASDPRARLVSMPRNGGTYLARNRALDEATGEFFTVHDSDDWAHPERVERQVRRLIEDQGLVSCSSRALRADDNLVFNLPGVSPSRENASSLMFRREKVMGAIGYYDQSRKGADTEYALRMVQHFGDNSHALLGEHLAFIRLRTGSLSRDEFKPGWRHPSRLTYRLGYQWHHANRKAEGLPLYIGRDGKGTQFARPARFLVDRESQEAQRRKYWDVLYVLDLRATAEQPPSLLDELLELVRAGRKTAVMHMESLLFPLNAEVEPYVPELQRLISTGVVGEVLFTDDAEVDTVVVRDPSSLQFAASSQTAVKANRALVLPEDAPRSPGAPGWTYSVADVEEHVYRVFGREAQWVMNDHQLELCSEPLNAPRRVISRKWTQVCGSPLRWKAPRPASDGSSLRIGRIVLDERDIESLDSIRQGATGPMVESVSLFVAPDFEAAACAVAEQHAWRVDVGTQPEDLYYAQIDILLLHGAPPRDERHMRHAMEAAASGCVVMADHAWRGILDEELCHGAAEMPAVYARIRSSADEEHRLRTASAELLERSRNLEIFIQTIAAPSGSNS